MTMKALLYFGLIHDEDYTGPVSDEIIAFLPKKKEFSKRKKIFYKSPEREIEFHDLGQVLFEYCKKMDIPDFSGLGEGCLAYLEVVPLTDREPLRVYLDAGFLKLLGNKGLGLDIHAQ